MRNNDHKQKTSLGYQSECSSIIVIANRWDGIGGRICAVLNAFSVAKALELDFRFVWKKTEEWGLSDPLELFDKDFLTRFRVSKESVSERKVLALPLGLTLAQAKQVCEDCEETAVITINQCFEVFRFSQETEKAAHTRFLQGFSNIGWNDNIRNLINAISMSKHVRRYSAIHLRAGDIVVGEWKQFVPVEKYLPYPMVEITILKILAEDGGQVALLSDNRRYANELKRKFPEIVYPENFYHDYKKLTACQQAIADIMVMFKARHIFGPKESAFSGLAANLHGTRVKSVLELIEADKAVSLFRRHFEQIDENKEPLNDLKKQVLARDICWFLDVFSDDLPLEERLILSQRAVMYDPHYCGALSRNALLLSLAGLNEAATETANRAVTASEHIYTHHDPMAESLATSISVALLISDDEARLSHPLLKNKSLISAPVEASTTSNKALSRDDIQIYFAKFKELRPFQIHHFFVLQNLHFQASAKSGLHCLSGQKCKVLAKKTQSFGDDPSRFGSWRTAGFQRLNGKGSFPQVLRNIETVSIILASALMDALAGDPMYFDEHIHIDSIKTHPTGLQWAHGWAFNLSNSTGPTYIGVFQNRIIISAGVAFLPRPDVRNNLQNAEIPLNCGFAIPVPLVTAANSQCSFRIIHP